MQTAVLNYGEIVQVYLFFCLLLVFIVAERLKPKRPHITPQGKRYFANFGLTVFTILILPVLPITFISAAIWANDQNIGLLNAFSLSDDVLIVGTLLLRGFISFFTHWLNHKIPLLWRFHRVHHLDTHLDVSSTVRFHPLEMPISVFIGLPLVIGFGLSPWVLILYELLDVAVTQFSHSNLKIPQKLDSLLRYVIVTPNLHTVHHSTVQQETDSNYSAVFPIWDIIFRTFKVKSEGKLKSMKLGLDVREPKSNHLGWLLISPFLSKQEYKRFGEDS